MTWVHLYMLTFPGSRKVLFIITSGNRETTLKSLENAGVTFSWKSQELTDI
ncbi:hypothetical protein DPMN_085197 [Dreissena polymorpha]|uniref:Uncharacterized protein n=1 Tax=Dreissena polymorpha TaxID=45954 RepID=A0A9D3YF93_DREPO|nr:hypothetical protein DPMN_085197 [Dreissena polymorpha]